LNKIWLRLFILSLILFSALTKASFAADEEIDLAAAKKAAESVNAFAFDMYPAFPKNPNYAME
jgi:hypothetical protein